MIKNIIFDWSGVVNDNLLNTYTAGMAVLKSCGAPQLSLEQYRKEWQQPYMKFYNKYCPDLTDEEQKSIYNQAISKCRKSKIYPGMKMFIRRCHELGKKIFVISSDSKQFIEEESARFKVKQYIDKVYGEVHDKTEGLNKALTEFSIDPRRSIFIGDTTHEIESAHKHNIIAGSVTWGIHTRETLSRLKPDYIFENISDMEKVIFKK